jgi:hypothetical protein
MLGTFSEKALLRYAEKAEAAFKERKVASRQGTEQHDNYGISEQDHSFIDSDESQDADDYSEAWDFTTCIRPNGTLYGIADGKKCRKGVETKAQPKVPSAKETKREGIRKRGEKAVTKAKAEKVLEDLAKQGAGAKNATERREKAEGGNREEQVRRLSAKAFLAKAKLRERAKKMKDGPQKDEVLAKIDRLTNLRGRLLKEQARLRDQAPKVKGEGWGRIPQWAQEGRSLA